MGATYTRQSTYADGDTINADDTNDEFDQLLAAFAASSGHTHDGTTAEGGPVTKLLGNTLTFGAATAGTDITITFDGETNDGVFKWMEDEDYFEFSDDILIATTEKLQFRDTAIYINSSTDGQLDLVADTEIQIAATTVDMNGNVEISGTTAQVGVLTTTATQVATGGITSGSNIVSDTDSTDDLGTTSVRWANLYVDAITATDQITATGFTGTLDGILGSGSAAAATVTTLDTSGAVNLNLVTDSTSSTSGALIVDGGVGIAKKLYVGTDLDVDGTANLDIVDIDGAVNIAADTTIASTNKIIFNDASQFIHAPSTTVLDLAATDEIELTATLVDVVGNFTNSGTIVSAGVVTANAGVVVDEMTLDADTLTATDDFIIDAAANIEINADGGTITFKDAGASLGTITSSGYSGTSAVSTVATTVTITDNESTNENNVVVFVAGADADGGNVGLESDGNLTYNPSTGTLSATNISVTGTLSTVDSVTMSANNAVVFEGATADAYETTLTVVDATADRTITLPNVSGTVPVLAAASNTAISATPAEINLIDGDTSRGTTAVASGDGILINDAGTMVMTNVDTVSTYFAGHSVGGGNIVTTGALDAGSITSGFGTIDTGASAITTTGLISGGSLDIDNVLINGTTIGHTDDTDLITLADGAVTVAGTIGSGAITSTGIVTGTAFTAGSAVLAEAELELLDGLTAGTAIASKVVTTDANIDTTGQRNLTISGELDAATGDFSGDVDIDGTLETDGLTVGGVAAKVAGKETIYVPATAMYPSTTNGCAALAQVETTALRPDLMALDFATGADEFAQFSIAFPKSWNEGTVTFQPYWTVTGTNTGTVAWGLSGIAVSSDDSINTAFGTTVVCTALAHSGTSNDLMMSVESGAVTIAGSPAAEDMCFFQVSRDVSADAQSGDARLLGIKVFFTTDAANDA